MLAIIIICVLLCILGVESICIGVLKRKLRDRDKEIASWKLACAAHEKEAQSW